MPALRLGILDQSPVPEGASDADALRNTIDLAQHAEALGYHRYWLAEHHATTALAGSSPEVLIGPVAAATSRIRVGSGGVMLPHYSPLKVAESFRILHALYPGRIDLGIGRAPGSDPLTAQALRRERAGPPPDDFPQQLAELIAWLERSFPERHPFAQVRLSPETAGTPELWLLGSSPDSAVFASQAGVAYAFADFINPGGAQIASLYRARWPAALEAGPRVAVAVAAIAADSDEEADRLAASMRAVRASLRLRGRLGRIPSVEAALAFLDSLGAGRELDTGRMVVGSPEQVRAGLEAVAEEYGAEELIVLSITHDHAARRRSYELLAEAFGLARAPDPAAALSSSA